MLREKPKEAAVGDENGARDSACGTGGCENAGVFNGVRHSHGVEDSTLISGGHWVFQLELAFILIPSTNTYPDTHFNFALICAQGPNTRLDIGQVQP